MKRSRDSLAFLALCLLTGCVLNPYVQNYRGYGARSRAVLVRPGSQREPTVRRGVNFQLDCMEMLRNGYVALGESRFNSGNLNSSGARSHARNVGAEVVILYSQYTDTVSGSVPLTTPHSGSAMTRASGSAYGPGGYAYASGTAVTTTYGTKTTYVPFSVRRYDHLATYWAKAKPRPFGAHVFNLTPEQQREVQSNKGVFVFLVVRGTPAFESDVLEGDIIRELNGISIVDEKHFRSLIDEHSGQSINVSILRNGVTVEKTLTLVP